MMNRFVKWVAVSALSAASIAGVAAAQSNALKSSSAPVSNPGALLSSLHAEAVLPLLNELGIRTEGAKLPNGQKVILAQAPNGLKFQLTPTACDAQNQRCRGIHMLAIFQTNAPARAVSAFNYQYAFISAGKDDSGVAYISRYDIADYGMPRGNLAVSLANYLHMADAFDRHLYEATNTVRQDVDDSDLAANGLNLRTILSDAPLAQEVGIDVASHEVSFEAVTDLVDTYIKADALNPGRLINSVAKLD